MDTEEQLSNAVKNAVKDAQKSSSSVSIVGAGSKSDWTGPRAGEMLSTLDHAGVIDYQPSELVVTARAGTPLQKLQSVLAQKQQVIAADPPLLGGAGTLGGAVASGLCGPARPWRGSLRDAVLGVKIIDGKGQVQQFGGKVMKNVAGYDISRLMAGSFGSLGMILEVSLRVAPMDNQHLTLTHELDAAHALDLCRKVARQPLPCTGTFWCKGLLAIRFSGSAAAISSAQQQVGGEVSDGNLWPSIRDHEHPFFQHSSPQRSAAFCLYRVVTPPAAPLPDVPQDQLAIEWGGGLRWLWHADEQAVCQYAADVGGWCWRIGEAFALEKAQSKIMVRIKQAFDPDQVFASPLRIGSNHAH